ncbi:GM15567 [Drosophila sechellia]|uniref:GM15567 n=1 Tax=Drosophila sechellia TaxID=7238 RepID=B4I8I8_DROSE|nr:GM15567 [Drosophila sechellia]
MYGETTLNKDHVIKFIRLKINHCLGCDEVEINFSRADNVHIIIYSLAKDLAKDLPAVTPVAQAILLLCSLTYPDSDSLQTIPQLEIGKGSVSMSFKVYPVDKEQETEPESESDLDEGPSTSKQALERLEQRAERKGQGGVLKEPAFQKHLCDLDPDSPFETFVKLFESNPIKSNDTIGKLAKTCLHVNEAVRLTEREFILEVFNQVRHIFEYITAQEYTVWFLVPCLGDNDQLRSKTLEDFDLTKVRTSIRPAGDTTNIWWDHTDHNIKDILLVAFQLDLATHVNQSVLVISHLETLAEFSTMQYVTAFFMNDFYAKKNTEPKWICHRYLERIIDVALFLGVIVIIEYPSAFTLLQEGRHLIKCFQKDDPESSSTSQWEIFEDVVKESESDLEFLKEAVGKVQQNV